MTSELLVRKLSKNATLPVRSTKNAAGYDIAAAHSVTIPKKGRMLVKTDLAIALPEGYYGRIAPRSGLALKHGIDVGAGVIDPDYRGPLGVVLFNHGDTDFEVKQGDRIAQLIIESIATPKVIEVDSLNETERKSGGFGSTGIKTRITEKIA
jgi:dUTP pyrophosphatase